MPILTQLEKLVFQVKARVLVAALTRIAALECEAEEDQLRKKGLLSPAEAEHYTDIISMADFERGHRVDEARERMRVHQELTAGYESSAEAKPKGKPAYDYYKPPQVPVHPAEQAPQRSRVVTAKSGGGSSTGMPVAVTAVAKTDAPANANEWDDESSSDGPPPPVSDSSDNASSKKIKKKNDSDSDSSLDSEESQLDEADWAYIEERLAKFAVTVSACGRIDVLMGHLWIPHKAEMAAQAEAAQAEKNKKAYASLTKKQKQRHRRKIQIEKERQEAEQMRRVRGEQRLRAGLTF